MNIRPYVISFAALNAVTTFAAVPLRWTVETSRVQPAVFDAYQGETLTFEAALQSKGKPLEAPLNYSFFWQTNGMGSTYWEAPCPVPSSSLGGASTNVLFATFTPSMDVGARVYNCFIGSPSNIYHAAFQLRLRPSPGALPNALPLPTPVIDFARVRVLNPPWGSGGGGGGCDTNAVDILANSAVVTNALTVATTNRVTLLESSKADKSALDAHVANTNNPHAVTAAQVGAVPLVYDENGDKTAVLIGEPASDIPINFGANSLANGDLVTASGSSSHAEGYYTGAYGNFSHAEGEYATASGHGAHAEGYNTYAVGRCSHTDGVNACTQDGDNYAYAWNGDENKQYFAHGAGTFNINPKDGLNGLFIGEQTLYAILTNKADKSAISATDPTFSNAVMAVTQDFKTNTYTKTETDALIAANKPEYEDVPSNVVWRIESEGGRFFFKPVRPINMED